jgi:hypothetical protein
MPKYCLTIDIIKKPNVKITFRLTSAKSFRFIYKDSVARINEGNFPLYMEESEDDLKEIKE